MFLFEAENEARRAENKVRSLGLWTERLSQTEIERLEPILAPATKLPHCLVTQDIPFDSHQVLTKLAQEACARGAGFHCSTKSLDSLEIRFEDGSWTITDEEVSVRAQHTLCAIGALTPQMIKRLSPRSAHDLPIQKCLVSVFNRRICDRIIAFRSEEALGMNLVPFMGGTTVNLGNTDDAASDAADDWFDTEIYGRDFAETLSIFVPGLQELTCQASFYSCQKLSNVEFSSHPIQAFGKRHYFWLSCPNNCHFFYPGKFTLAPIAAREFVTQFTEAHKPRPLIRGVQKGDPPGVAERPYYKPFTHVLSGSPAVFLRQAMLTMPSRTPEGG